MLMDYRIKRVGQSDELEHALFGIGKKKSSSSSGSGSGQQGAKKGSTWSNHLYIARQKAGDGWRYFYSQAELQAAKAKGAVKQAAKTVGDTARKGVATVKRAGSKAADIASGKYARDIDQNLERTKEDLERREARAKRLNDKEYDTDRKVSDAWYRQRNASYKLDDLEKEYNTELKKYKSGDTSSIERLGRLEQEIKDTQKIHDDSKAEKEEYFNKGLDLTTQIGENDRRIRDEKLATGAEGIYYTKSPRGAQDSLVYKISDLAGKGRALVNSGKSAVSKFLSDESTMAKEAWNGSIAKKAIDKGKNAVDNLMAFAKKKIQDIRDSHTTVNGIPLNELKAKTATESSKDEETKETPKNNRQYNGTSKKAEGDETRATKDMYKNSSDEYIEALYFNSRKNDGSGVSKYLENEYNYRKAAQEANYLGRLTDTLSDDAEAALKKYGKNSDTYKRAYKKMEEAIDQLHEAELELARYEKNR